MKRSRLVRLLCALLCVCLLAACGGGGEKASNNGGSDGNTGGGDSALTEKISLSFSHHDSANSAIGRYWQSWADKIYEDSNGMIEITVYAGAALAAPADGINALNSGVCDILWTCTGFFPGQFPVTEAAVIPFNGVENAVQAAYIMDEAYNTIPELKAEWEGQGLKVLQLNCAPASYLLSNVRIAEPADAQGQTIRCMSGLPTQLISSMGASAVVSPSGEIFTSMEKGILQGTVFDLGGAKGFNLFEVSPYLLDMVLYCGCVPCVMLQSTWDSLPAEAQEIIERNSGLTGMLNFAVEYEIDAQAYYNQFSEAGRLVQPTAEQQTKWNELAAEVSADWIAQNTSDSLDYQSVVDQFGVIIEKYKDVTEPMS